MTILFKGGGEEAKRQTPILPSAQPEQSSSLVYVTCLYPLPLRSLTGIQRHLAVALLIFPLPLAFSVISLISGN